MLKIDNATLVFNKGKANEIRALQNVNLNLQSSDFVVLLGSNGSGKSTLLNSIAGNVKLSSGEIFIQKKNVSNQSDYQRSKYVARIFQNPLLGTSPDLTIAENFRIAALRTKNKTLNLGLNKHFKTIVQDKISVLNMNLETKLDTPMRSLSGGQRQAITLLMATMDDTKILLLDEPAAALDPKSAQMVMEIANRLITELKLTAILVTHRMKDAIEFGNKIIFMREGKIQTEFSSTAKKNTTMNELVSLFD